ncbi:MAG: hypothetical protein IH584_04745, partial [Candidatus Aminicenantes bacterium]|nr:hypothetical protein [Candidatus Aminicenantes bacterium]
GYLASGGVDGWLSKNLPCLGDCGNYDPEKGDLFVCALIEPRKKLAACRGIRERGGKFHTFIDSGSGVPRRNIFGTGCILAPMTGLTSDIILNEFITVQPHAGIGHDVQIGAGTTVGAHCLIAGYVHIGEGVVLQPNVVVLPHIRIGDYSRVGAGSVVVRDVAPETSVWGVPAKKVDALIEAV